MALINCPECNREVSDTAEACPQCGFGVAKYIKRQKRIFEIQEEAEKEAYLYVKRIKKEEQEKAARAKREEENRKNSVYNEAVNKFASDSSMDVIRAEQLFESILGWKDADDYKGKCKDRIEKLKWEEAEKKAKASKAIIIKVMVTIIVVIAIAGIYIFLRHYRSEKAKEEAYRDAIDTFEAAGYEAAMKDFMILGDYKDCEEYIVKCKVNIPIKKYNNGYFLQAYQELILLSPEIFERVMGDSGITFEEFLYDCQKGCADAGHKEYGENNYIKAADYFAICYEYDTVSYEEEYLFTEKILDMKGIWNYYEFGQLMGSFDLKESISTSGIDSQKLNMKRGKYSYEEKDGIIYVPELNMYIYPPELDGENRIAAKQGVASYVFYRD